MSKLSKAINNPSLYIKDFIEKRKFEDKDDVIYIVGFSTWKTYMRKYFSDKKLVFLDKNISKKDFTLNYKQKILRNKEKSEIFIWGFKIQKYLDEFIKENKISVKYVEDGFIRSVQLGATKAPPLSLTMDSLTPYFDATKPSDLENMLNSYSFENKSELLSRARTVIQLILANGISKYNNSPFVDMQKLYGPKKLKRVLVIGQVEDDASIKYGCNIQISNNDLVRLAAKENPNAQIIYKPHPDVLNGHRDMLSNPSEVSDIATIITEDIALSSAFETIDHVYTITSLSGFEALLRGIKTTTIGSPFYSGWGLTDDRQKNERRKRKLTIEQLFAICYIVYPKYFETTFGQSISLEDTIKNIIEQQNYSVLASSSDFTTGAKNKEQESITLFVGEKKYYNLIKVCYPDKVFKLIDINLDDKITINRLKALNKNPLINELWIFAINVSKEINNFILSYTGNKLFVSEGLLHSVGDMNKEKSASFIFDKHCMYYNTKERSELEELLNKYDFTNNPKMLEDANQYKTLILKNSISKYNPITGTRTAYETKTRKRVLILTQPVVSPKVRLSNPKIFSILELINLAKSQNSDAEIIVKPHPSQLEDLKIMSTLRKNSDFLLDENISLALALDTIDHVYTISSLGGFEAALRDIPVTVLGTPFYAGYGFTDDICKIHREKTRTIEEVLAIVLLQTDFIDISLKSQSDFSNVLDNFQYLFDKTIPIINENIKTEMLIASISEPNAKKTETFSKYTLKPEYTIDENKHTFMYLPWMPTHGDKLIKQLNISDKYDILPLELLKDFDEEKRGLLSEFSRNNSDMYRRLLLKHLIPIKNKISGVILTFDWHPSMRMLAKVCKELNIETYLILHESVFLDMNKYYWHEETNINIPICDHIITWGNLQKDIFIDRGVSENKLIALGTPKFDIYHNYEPLLTKDEFCNIYGLDTDKKIFLYALQPMDVQVNQKLGIAKQREAINDIMDYCEKNNTQLILREAPAPVNTLFSADRKRVENNPNFFIDKSRDYLTPPEESIYHADIVFSINSTMLFEALLLNTSAISTKYIEFEQIWNNIGLPFATNKSSLYSKIIEVTNSTNHPEIKWEWAKKNLSNGDFDGKSALRIKNYLENKIILDKDLTQANLFDTTVSLIAISNTAILQNSAKYLPKILNTKNIITPLNNVQASICDEYIQWGITETDSKKKLRLLMKSFGQKPFIIEDGFIRSVGIGLSGEAALSISLCGKTAYYNAHGISNFEKALNSDKIYSDVQIDEAKKAIQNIVKNNISKYNDSPLVPIKIGIDGRSKVLVIDQRYGDQSVQAAMASEKDFQNMLIDAINENQESDIIIKRHPDAIKGGKGSYYNDSNVEYTKNIDNVFLIDYDIHPHKLLEICDKIYVVSSGLGFEALLYGKEVNCYGIPFYSNWGVTNDKKKLERRVKIRTVEEIFYVSYIEYSRYYSPTLDRVCDINECIDYIVGYR